ncbi:hypothetical protein C0J52_11150, partial [Blattella germanica]
KRGEIPHNKTPSSKKLNPGISSPEESVSGCDARTEESDHRDSSMFNVTLLSCQYETNGKCWALPAGTIRSLMIFRTCSRCKRKSNGRPTENLFNHDNFSPTLALSCSRSNFMQAPIRLHESASLSHNRGSPMSGLGLLNPASPFSTFLLQFLMPSIFLASSFTASIHLFLGLPTRLIPPIALSKVFFGILLPSIRRTPWVYNAI